MTIDERIDRLTERHEALAQSVELLTADVRAIGAHVDALATDMRTLTANVSRTETMMNNLLPAFGAIVELVRRHETRLDGLEGR